MRTPGPGARTPGLVCKPCAPRGHPHTHRLSGPRILLLRLSSALSAATVAILAQGTHWALAAKQAFCNARPYIRGKHPTAEHQPLTNTPQPQTNVHQNHPARPLPLTMAGLTSLCSRPTLHAPTMHMPPALLHHLNSLMGARLFPTKRSSICLVGRSGPKRIPNPPSFMGRNTHRGARTHDHKVKGLALYRLS